MSEALFPCINCENRYPGCHSKCEAYIIKKKQWSDIQDKIHKESELRGVLAESHLRRRKTRIRKRYD